MACQDCDWGSCIGCPFDSKPVDPWEQEWPEYDPAEEPVSICGE